MSKVVSHENMQQLIDTGGVDEFTPSKSDATAEAKPADEAKTASKSDKVDLDEDGLTAEERKILGAKYDQVVGKRHRMMKEAKEAAAEAESFAETQYRERKAAEKRADELEARLKALESQAAPKVEEAKEPQPGDFKDAVEFARALAKFEADKAVKADRQSRAEEEAKRINEELNAARRARNEAFAATVPDYQETVDGLSEIQAMVPDYVAQYILESKQSAAAMYYLGKHPDEFKAILKLSPITAIAALGKLEGKLEAVAPVKTEPTPEPRADKSRAPTPITPVTGNQSGTEKSLAEMNTRETIEYWEARNKATSYKRQRH
jgi:hypothetical protein